MLWTESTPNMLVRNGFEVKLLSEEASRKLSGSGYEEISTGLFVSEEDAFDYALEHCLEIIPEGIHKIKWTQEFKDMLVEWFYSGNWIRVE